MIQSNYLPWRGYFDFIDDVDIFVIYDDVQYTRKDWRNRNLIKTADGTKWITVPVKFSQKKPTLIKDTEIDFNQPWQRKHIGNITQAYRKAPFFELYSPELFSLLQESYRTISELNIALIRWCMEKFCIDVPLVSSSTFSTAGGRSERIVDLIKQLGGSEYLVGPAAKAYINEKLFEKEGIRLLYKSYRYPPYKQQFGPFEGLVSAIDLLFNCGVDARRYLKSLSPNRPAFS